MAVADGKRCIRNAAYRHYFALRTTSTGKLVDDSTTPLVYVLDEGGASNTLVSPATELPVTLAAVGTGGYFIDLSAAEMTRTGAIVITAKTTTAGVAEVFDTLLPEPCQDSGVAQASTASTLRLRSAANATNNAYQWSVVEIVRGTCAGQCRLIVSYVGATTTATVDRDWLGGPPDTTSVYKVHPASPVDIYSLGGSATALAVMKLIYDSTTEGAVDMASPTDSVFTCSGLITTDDYYVESYVLFTSGVLATLGRPISAYSGVDQEITVATPFPTAPANGDTFVIIGNAS